MNDAHEAERPGATEPGTAKLAFDNAGDAAERSLDNSVDTDGGDGTVTADRGGRGGRMERGAGGSESPHSEKGTQGLAT